MTTEHENRCTLPRDHHGACALPSAIEQHRRNEIWRVSRTTDLGGVEIHTFGTEAEADEFAAGWIHDDADDIEVNPSSPTERNDQLEEQARAEKDYTDAARTLVQDHGYSASDLDDLLFGNVLEPS